MEFEGVYLLYSTLIVHLILKTRSQFARGGQLAKGLTWITAGGC
jgi:hypothetical protein